MNQPAILKKQRGQWLEQFSDKFPYFQPLHYFEQIRQSDYEKASLNLLFEIFPANRILIYDLFVAARKVVVAPSNPEDQPLIPNKTLQHLQALNQDYLAGQGIEVDDRLPDLLKEAEQSDEETALSDDKDLMVVMSFSEWLKYLQEKTEKAKDEAASKSALRAMWQKQRLTEAIEEEEEEIPEDVFRMAVNSISSGDEVVNESIAEVYAKQGKKDKAVEVYKKLSLQNPEKSAYFARKIEEVQKDLEI